MKKYICALFLLCLVFCCAGCGQNEIQTNYLETTNAIRIMRQSSKDGKISLSYIFPVNSKELKEMKFDNDEIKLFKFYLCSYVNSLVKINKQKQVMGVEIGSCVYFVDVDGIGFSMLFENLDAQKEFFGVNDDSKNEDDGSKKTVGLFFRKTTVKTTFPISSKQSADNLKQVCKMSVNSWCEELKMSEEKKNKVTENFDKSVFIYDFAVQEKGVKSKDMYQDANFYHNVFLKTEQDIEGDNTIVFWSVYINKPIWYLSAIVCVGLGICASFVCLRSKKNKNNKKN